MIVRNVLGRNYEFGVTGLLQRIDPDGSYFKLKTDMVLLMLKKAQPLPMHWEHLTSVEAKTSDAKK